MTADGKGIMGFIHKGKSNTLCKCLTSVALALHIASACNYIAVCSEKEVCYHHIHVLERSHLTEVLALTSGHNSDPTSAGSSTASTSQMSIPS
jgi:hypothetical protein